MSNYSDPITATGSLITFDAPSGGVFDSLSVPITPTQDLHGYDHPWPGGGGKNKLDLSGASRTTYGVTYEDKGQYYWIHGTCGTAYASTYLIGSTGNEIGITIPASTEMVMSMTVTGAEFVGTPYAQIDVNGTTTNYPFGTPFTLSSDGVLKFIMLAYGYLFNKERTYDIKVCVQLEQGSTPTAFTPYSNICPISGIDNLSVYVSPTTQQAQATTYNVSFGAAGTVYGGTVDVVTGVLTVDKAIVDLGSISWTYNSGYTYPYFTGTMPNDCVVGSTVRGQISVLCSIYESIQNIGAADFRTNDHNFQCCLNANVSTRRLIVQNSAYTDAAAFKTAMNGVQLVYDLGTPVTYQLTPTQISALVGSNNVWVDISAVITLIYRLLQIDRQTGATSIGKNAESLLVSKQFGAYSKVVINVTAELYYESGNDTGRTLTISCPWGTQAMADNILATLEGYQYQPYEAQNAIIDPAAELGDGLTVNGVYGGIFKLTIRSGVLHSADVSSPQDEEIEHEYKFTPAAERKIERRINNMESELSVQADQISAKVDRQGGDPSSVSWTMDSDVFKVQADGNDVLTIDENGLTVNGDGTFTGSVQAKNIAYGGSNGTFSGGGISGHSISSYQLGGGINTSLGNADYSADVFSGAAVAMFTKAKNLYCVGKFLYNGTEFTPAVYYLLDQNYNVVRLRVLKS